jgi:CRP/FNR family transcriptional regulator, cyclic AMP receptor protein
MNRNQKKAFLTDHFALENLSAADVDYLADNARTRVMEAGETVFFKDDPSTDLIAVVSGGVQIRTVSEDGKELLLNAMSTGEMFGEIGIIDGGNRTADAVAVERTELLTIDRRFFLGVIERNPAFCKSLMALLCGRIRATSQQAEDLALLDLRTRLAKKLVALAEMRDCSAGDGDFVLRLTQSEVGAMMGTTREAVSKHLNAWARDGLISLGRKEIVILNREGLRRFFDT